MLGSMVFYLPRHSPQWVRSFQGRGLSPLSFFLFTNDYRGNNENRHFFMFADDSVIVSLLDNDVARTMPVFDDFFIFEQ